MRRRVQTGPDSDDLHVRRWLAGIWIVLTMLILGSMAMTLFFASPPTVTVFFIGIWLVVSVFAAYVFRRRRQRA